MKWIVNFLDWLLPKWGQEEYDERILVGGCEDEIKVDDRDLEAPGSNVLNLPVSYDIKGLVSRVEHQGTYNSCVGCSVTTAIETLALEKKWTGYHELSRMHSWNMARKLTWGKNGWKENRGVFIRDCWKACQKNGVTVEKLFPYNKKNSTRSLHLSWIFAWHPKFRYYWIKGGITQKKEKIKQALFHRKAPVVFAMHVDNEFMGIRDLSVYPKKPGKKGGFAHAMIIIGYDNNDNSFLVQNSWGRRWGRAGRCKVNQDHLAAYGWDLSYAN